MLGFRKAEVVCLLALVLDCLYDSCCRLSFFSMEFLSFGLRIKGSFLFIIYCALHQNRGCLCLLESSCVFSHHSKPVE